ncbi:hypothetical protein [Halomonas urumqiensis]|nr:hypothetical protein [Halomonas urumqiensis]
MSKTSRWWGLPREWSKLAGKSAKLAAVLNTPGRGMRPLAAEVMDV